MGYHLLLVDSAESAGSLTLRANKSLVSVLELVLAPSSSSKVSAPLDSISADRGNVSYRSSISRVSS